MSISGDESSSGRSANLTSSDLALYSPREQAQRNVIRLCVSVALAAPAFFWAAIACLGVRMADVALPTLFITHALALASARVGYSLSSSLGEDSASFLCVSSVLVTLGSACLGWPIAGLMGFC
jgi:hypothetical protein